MPIIKVLEDLSQVEFLTRQGWEVDEFHDVDVLRSESVQVTHPPLSLGGMPYTAFEIQLHKIRSIVAIMRLNDDSALAKLNADMAEVEAKRAAACLDLAAMTRDRDSLKKERDTVQRRYDVAAQEVDTGRTLRTTDQIALNRYERSIAAVRKEIGDGRMREILDAAGVGEKKA